MMPQPLLDPTQPSLNSTTSHAIDSSLDGLTTVTAGQVPVFLFEGDPAGLIEDTWPLL